MPDFFRYATNHAERRWRTGVPPVVHGPVRDGRDAPPPSRFLLWDLALLSPEAPREYIQSAANSAYDFGRQNPGRISHGSESGSSLFR